MNLDLEYLRASDGTGEAVLAHIDSPRNQGSTVLELDNIDNWNSKVIVVTGKPNANGYISASTQKVFYGHTDNGNVIIEGFAPGYTDTGNTTDEIAIVKMCTSWADHLVEILKDGLVPAGTVNPFAGATAPFGWLLCEGQEVSRTDYARLYAVIGDVYGDGDGVNTFNLPNMKGRVPVGMDASQTEFDTLGKNVGAKTHTLTVAQMPSHNHGAGGGGSSVITWLGSGGNYALASGSTVRGYNVENNGGGQAHNNIQPSITLSYIIKA